MAKVKHPLLSGDASGDFNKQFIFRRGGVVSKYFKPRNPNSAAQQAQRLFMRSFYMAALTKAIADGLYSALNHLHKHGANFDLTDDDHPQYLTEARADQRYLRTIPQGAIEAFPIGAVFISISSQNPAVALGYGIWEAFGAGRVMVGYDASDDDFNAAEEIGGSKSHVLSSSEMPSHTHAQDAHTHLQDSHAHGVAVGHGGSASGLLRASGYLNQTGLAASGTFNSSAGTATNQNATATNQSAGGGVAHNNLQPFIVAHFWKRIS